MARIAIIIGHSQQNTYCEALGQAYKAGAESNGHEAQLFVLSQMNFDPILREGYGKAQDHEPDLQAAYDALKSSSHAVIVFPLWCGDMPAILKGFIERLVQPDLVRLQKDNRIGLNLGIFSNTSVRVIVTMGMPALLYRLYFGAHAIRLLRRNILQFIGMRPVKTTIFGMIGNEKRRERYLRIVHAMGIDGS